MFRENTSLSERIHEALKPTPVKKKIQMVSSKLRMQVAKLDKSISQMEARDRALHDKCVKALESRDTQTAAVFANECVQIRKLIKTSLSGQISLEQATLRLETVEQFGDMAASMGSVRDVVAKVRRELEGKLPQISTGISDVEESLENLTMKIGHAIDSDEAYSLASDDSAKILKEADLVADQRMREKFPDIPAVPADPHRLR